MKNKLLISWAFLLLASLILLPYSITLAQSSDIQLQSLLIELWPEYDRPELLVIYRGELSANVPLPAQLSFRLPGHIEDMHAVAVEENGALLSVKPDSISLTPEDGVKILTFPVTAARFQFEYYDSLALTKQDQARKLAYSFTAPYAIETVTFQLQEPSQTQNFSMTPEPSNTFTSQNGLAYHSLEIKNVASNQTVELSATYSRSTDELTAASKAANPQDQSLDISVVSGSPVNETNNVAYILLGAGVLLLVGTGGYWWWSRRSNRETIPPPPVGRRSQLRRKRGTAAKGAVVQTSRETAGARPGQSDVPLPAGGFCYRCGTPLRDDAEFCHVCGAKRRRK